MRFSDFKIVETNARLQKRFDKWQAEYLTWQQLKNQSTMDTIQGELMVTSQAFDQSMKDQKAQLDREAEFFRQNGFGNQVDQFLNDMSKPMQRVEVDPVPGLQSRKNKTEESKKQKDGDYARGSDPMPSAKPGRTTHPLKDKLVGSKENTGNALHEAEARIQHAEDIVFWEGSAGAMRALQALKNLEGESHKDVTIKWDGSPALIFGRNENGEFILTDKSGFGAKGYNGRATSAQALQQMLMNRPGASNPDPAKKADYHKFVGNMSDIFDEYEKAVPESHRGYFKGDLLYYNTPEIQDGNYIFKPNIVQYAVDAKSELGKKIGQSKTGIVIHREIDESGAETPFNSIDIFQGNEVLVVPSVSVERPADVDNAELAQLEQIIKQNASGIDELLNVEALTARKMKKFPDLLYNYVNNKVDSSLDNLGADFAQWLENHPKISNAMKAKVLEYIKEHLNAFKALWTTVSSIMKVKDDIIRQFDLHDQTVKATIPGQGEGGEGYVLAHPQGDIKLVPREYFTKANRAVER